MEGELKVTTDRTPTLVVIFSLFIYPLQDYVYQDGCKGLFNSVTEHYARSWAPSPMRQTDKCTHARSHAHLPTETEQNIVIHSHKIL